MNELRQQLLDEALTIVRKFPGRNFVTDSRKVKKGDIFVAVSGVNIEGKNFIPDAVANGAEVVVYSGTLPQILPQIEQQDQSLRPLQNAL